MQSGQFIFSSPTMNSGRSSVNIHSHSLSLFFSLSLPSLLEIRCLGDGREGEEGLNLQGEDLGSN